MRSWSGSNRSDGAVSILVSLARRATASRRRSMLRCA